MSTGFSFSRVFFAKNTFARLALLALLLGGFISYTSLIKETTPDLAIGVGIVFTEWAGANPQSIEQEVTNKVEKELKSVKGLKRLQSGSYAGFSLIVVEFEAYVEQVDAMTRLRAKVAAAEGELPRAVKKPTIVEASINDTPIYSIRLTGDVDIGVVAAVAKDLQRELERTAGVNKVAVSGERNEVILIRLLGARLAAYGIAPTALRAVLDQAGVDLSLGDFDGEKVGAGFRFLGRFREIEDIRRLPVATTSTGRTVLLGELSEIKRGPEQEISRTYFAADNDEFREAIDITLTKRPGADAIKTIKAVERVVERHQATASWPSELQVTVVADESVYIKNDLQNIFNNGWQAMLAVFGILLISLTWREALIAGLAIPITFAGALIIVLALGYSLNQIVIIGMVLALGLLVDDFILMMEGMHENVYTRGLAFSDAAIATIKTYAIPSLTGSLTTILAMAPLMGIAGIEGKFIRQMPVTTIACLVVSYLVSIFVAVPLSRFVLAKQSAKKTRMDRLTERCSENLVRLLDRRFVRNRKQAWFWVAMSASLFVLGYALFSTLPTELSPKGDGRSMGITIELSPDASLATSQRCADAVGEQLVSKPYIQSVTKHVGEKSPYTLVSTTDQLSPTTGFYLVGFSAKFVPKKDRDQMVYEYVPQIRSDLEAAMLSCPGGQAFFSPQLGGASAEDPIQIEIIGEDMSVLRQLAQSVAAEVSTIPGASDVRDNYGVPKVNLRTYPNREALNFYQLSTADVASQVRFMMTSDEVGKFVQGGVQEDLPIRMGYAWPSRNGALGGPTTMNELQLLNVITGNGRSVPLSSLVDWRLEESALSILHKNGERTLMVMAKTDGRTAGEILSDLKPRLDRLTTDWPAGYRIGIAGEAESSAEAFGSASKMLVLALFLVFALLALQFDSLKQPFVIMSAIPLALTGTFFGFFVMQLPFSFMAMVGVIALVGIVVNDTIIMIETMNNYLKKGKTVSEAAAHGAADRLRPIVTTSVTTIVGLVPLAISQKMWLPLSTTVISGLLFATFLALFIVPCLFLLLTPNSSDTRTDVPVIDSNAVSGPA